MYLIVRTAEVWVVNLYISQAMVIKNLQLLLKDCDNIREILIIVGIDALGICLAIFIAEMIPCRGRYSKFNTVMLLLGQDSLEVLQLLNMRR